MDRLRATDNGLTNSDNGEGKSRSRTSDIYARIRDDVIVGHFPPGTKLKIEALRERYGLGATPIREALSMLAADGLVERVDQRGFRVAEVTGREFEELLAIRCAVEERALRQSIERGGKEWEDAIVLSRYRLTTTTRVREDGQYDLDWERCHKAFHMSLVAGCGSNLLLRLSDQFYNENNRYRFVARLNTSARPDVYGEHEDIADAALARDADLAVSLLIRHYKTTGEMLRAELRRSEDLAAAPAPNLAQAGAAPARKPARV